MTVINADNLIHSDTNMLKDELYPRVAGSSGMYSIKYCIWDYFIKEKVFIQDS